MRSIVSPFRASVIIEMENTALAPTAPIAIRLDFLNFGILADKAEIIEPIAGISQHSQGA